MTAVDFSKVYSATYSSVPVYEFKLDGESVMRRRSDDWINATHILKVAGFDKPARTRILEREVQKGVHEKVQGGYGKYQGTWIPLPEGRLLAERNNIIDKLRPIFDYVAGDRSPPPAPKHTTAASKPRASKNTAKRNIINEEVFSAVKPARNMAPPPFIHEQQYEISTGFDDTESIEQATLESSSMIADEEMMTMSQNGNFSRKRKRGINEAPVMSITEQEHILYGDQLLDYFMTVGDAPEATRVPPPQPPSNFCVDRPIDDSGNTALHWACAMGDLEIVKDLLRRGADVKALSVHEETPLVRAVLFTNNYEKRTFPPLLELLWDTVSFRDWFGATIFHHIAETTRSKGKWKSSRYYCDVLLDKLRVMCSVEEMDSLLSFQDHNGDTAALVAARNGAFRLVDLLLARCPRAGDLVNKKGETAASITRRAHPSERDIPPPPSSITMGNDQLDGEAPGLMNPDTQSSHLAQESSSPATTALLTKIGVIMAEANKKLAVSYGSSKANQQDSDDVANPEILYEQLELDRQKVQKETAVLQAQEAGEQPVEVQLDRYEQLRSGYESLLEQVQQGRLRERISSVVVPAAKEGTTPPATDHDKLLRIYQLARQLCSAQKARRAAVKDLAQQTADAGVSTKFDVHRKLVALATGLKEEDLDPMAAELAETLEFERTNGKGDAAEMPDPDSRKSATFPFPGTTVSVDA
ncbi:putative APSES transcription factor [Aspergillus saccharolyticus JOP 1030-1]|uniref:Cell pattern formation-associated protein stuA n=1 Tax=Aspergillus saccharolyticus JOP 1030-1 TaxID=1450539 RepID=A0A318ZWI1_9EURO|nr:putative apses transcription factor [Aspergillus saccharolyticus JOP 1030-1]PYH48673.1 putative apses transcription factor [Aspergillus saccharolyticus JOP 1030-1]